ncbi:MAG TPA: hypothetical protein VNW06_02420 [Cytophagaceae bacterium]|jgi:hypothetical protein|nr:hypothetical protein [Cytophagaceae bacterium]
MEKTAGKIKSIQSVSNERVDFILTTAKGDISFTVSASVEAKLNAIREDGRYIITYSQAKDSNERHEVDKMELVRSWIGGTKPCILYRNTTEATK